MIKMKVPEGVNQVLAEDGSLLAIIDGCIDAQPHQVNGFLAQGFVVETVEPAVNVKTEKAGE